MANIPIEYCDEKASGFSLLRNAKAAGINGRTAITGFILSWTALALIFMFVPVGKGLTFAGRATLAVTVWAIITWLTDSVPKAISGLAIPLLLIVSGAFSQIPEAFSGYTNNTTFLVIGTFLFAAAMNCTGLDRRIALAIVGKSSKVGSIIRGIFLANLASALFIPATVARASTYYPVAQGLKDIFKGHKDEAKIRKTISIAAVGFSASLGAPLFLTSHMPNVVVATILAKTGAIDLSWTKWFLMMWPMVGLTPIIFFWQKYHFKVNSQNIPGGAQAIGQEKASLGKIQAVDWLILACFAIAVTLWVTKSLNHMQTGMVTLLALLVLFMPGLLPIGWKTLQGKTMWGTWLMLAGAISLASALSSTGVAKLIASNVFKVIPHVSGILVLLMVMVVIQIFRLGIASSVAATSLIAPILAALAPMLHLNPVPFVLSVAILDPFTFLIPVELASCVVAYGSEDFSFVDFFKAGAPVTLMAIVYVLVIMVPWWSLMGYPLGH
ncbi:citrate carrier [Peptococcaceae bacterium CEB3]|nr:citrate carrier [Peptococcaceae bacterium CEB3]